jgi:hypothetical protein
MMAQVRRDFQGCSTVETFPRAGVQPMGDGVQLTWGVARQARALGPYWRNNPLVCSLVPRGAIRIGKEDLDASRSARRSCSAISLP